MKNLETPCKEVIAPQTFFMFLLIPGAVVKHAWYSGLSSMRDTIRRFVTVLLEDKLGPAIDGRLPLTSSVEKELGRLHTTNAVQFKHNALRQRLWTTTQINHTYFVTTLLNGPHGDTPFLKPDARWNRLCQRQTQRSKELPTHRGTPSTRLDVNDETLNVSTEKAAAHRWRSL